MDDEKKVENKKDSEVDKNYIEILKEAQKKMPGLVLPSMGMIDNEVHVEINGSDYIKK